MTVPSVSGKLRKVKNRSSTAPISAAGRGARSFIVSSAGCRRQMCHVRIAPTRIGRAPQVAGRRTLRLIICPSAASLNTLTIVGAVDPRLDASRPAFGHDEVERGARAVVHDFGNRPRADWAGVQDT